jgi:hypothetical protein
MSTNTFANRRSPSGPLRAEQLPYYNLEPVSASVVYALIGAAGSIGAIKGTEYEIPVAGRLGTLQIRNNPVGDDAVNATYQVLKNGGAVGDPVIIGNNAVGPVKVDLSAISVNPGDLIAIEVTTPMFGGAAPTARILFTYLARTSSPAV